MEYESPITAEKEIMAKVKVFVYAEGRHGHHMVLRF